MAGFTVLIGLKLFAIISVLYLRLPLLNGATS